MELFLLESSDHARSLEGFLDKIESSAISVELFTEMHVHAHTIKGAAAMVGFNNTSHIARFLEKILLELSQNNLEFDSEVKQFILDSINIIHKFIRNISVGELNEAIILKDIAKKYDILISKVQSANA